jgi:hypothetical protein
MVFHRRQTTSHVHRKSTHSRFLSKQHQIDLQESTAIQPDRSLHRLIVAWWHLPVTSLLDAPTMHFQLVCRCLTVFKDPLGTSPEESTPLSFVGSSSTIRLSGNFHLPPEMLLNVERPSRTDVQGNLRTRKAWWRTRGTARRGTGNISDLGLIVPLDCKHDKSWGKKKDTSTYAIMRLDSGDHSISDENDHGEHTSRHRFDFGHAVHVTKESSYAEKQRDNSQRTLPYRREWEGFSSCHRFPLLQ